MFVWSPNWESNFLKSKLFFDKMLSILINIMQHEQYLFSFQAHIPAVSLFLSKSRHIMLESHVSSQANNKCNRVKGWWWIWLIYVLCNFLLHNNMLHVFKSNHHCSWKFHKFHRKTPVLESLFEKLHCRPISCLFFSITNNSH